MAWVEASKYRPVETGWYWVELPDVVVAVPARWKYVEFSQRAAWLVDGLVQLEHSVIYPVRYWTSPIRRPALPREGKIVRKVKLPQLREEPTP